MSALEVLTDAAVLMDDDGIISRVGPYSELRAGNAATVVEVQGTLFPGFVDCHTHAVFGAPRLADHERRARGETYQAIAAAGGGILSSVRDVRARSSDALLDSARGRLSAMLALGTTTVEIKSGYGLALDHELKQLDVVRALAAEPVSVIGTFLGAHEVPEEHRANPDAYVDLVIHEMLPAIKRQGVARFCDVFCEPGVFTVAQSRAVLEAAKALGFGLKLHADELEPSGGAELAAALGATSADHLAAISEAGIAALAASPAVAVLLPGTDPESARLALDRVRIELRAQNLAHPASALDISLGSATAERGERLNDALKQADAEMYREKAARRGDGTDTPPAG